MKAYKKVMNGIAALEKSVLSLLLILVTVITFVNVVVRKFSDSQFAWTEELVINLFVLMIMMGCALCAREGSLISLSLIFDRLKVGGKKIFAAIITVANTLFWVLLLKTGWDKVATQLANGKRTFSLGWPEWVFTVFLPLGAILLIIHTIEFCVDVMTDNAECVNFKCEEEAQND
ncbi:MAG: TRAP transporter small permease [Candidatus Fimivivens sp.]